MKIAIGTKNPTKVNAVKKVFGDTFTYVEVAVQSGVSPQPFSDEETIQGAVNRARAAVKETGADIGIGLEGGVQETPHGLFLCNWGSLVTSKDLEPILGGGARIRLPEAVAGMLRHDKKELAEAMEFYTNQKNIRKKEGAIGIFTNGNLDRTAMFYQVVLMLKGQLDFRTNQAVQ
jgi:inosine/xanthosine triphosphatase